MNSDHQPLSRRQKAIDAALVSVVNMRSLTKASFALARLFGQVVRCSGLAAADFARAALFETLFSATMGFHFGHDKLLWEQRHRSVEADYD